MIRGAPLVMLAGCSQIFGLEDTRFDQKDAPTDAPSVCDGPPVSCVGTTGRSVCGQIFQTGANAGIPLRVADPTGELCQPGVVDGPCALTVGGLTKAEFFAGGTRVAGTVDDCGRFVVPDLPTAETDVAVVFTGTDFQQSATLVLRRPTQIGADLDVTAFSVSLATIAEWSTQVSGGGPAIETGTGYLVLYTTTQFAPLMGEQVAMNSGSPFSNPAGTVPWAAYFSGDSKFGALDLTLQSTDRTGTALAVLPGGTFSLEGFRTGRRCKIEDLQQVGNTLVHVIQVDC